MQRTQNYFPTQPKTDFVFLGFNRLNELIREYYFSDKTLITLSKEYDLPTNKGFEKQFPWFQTYTKCKVCDHPTIRVPHHRNRPLNEPHCPSCGHLEAANCICPECKQKRLLKEFEIKTALIKHEVLIDEIMKIFDNNVKIDKVVDFVISVQKNEDEMEYPF